MNEAALELDNVAVPGRLAPLTLSVAPGCIHALVGTNGSGKTTALRCALGLETFSGRLHRSGGRITFVPHQLAFDGVLPVTVREHLAMSRTRRPVAFGVSSTLDAQMLEALRRLGAETLINRMLHTLSAGERRRIALADALAPRPSVLLLDEPETGLDDDGLAMLEAQLRHARDEGCAVVLVSHDGALVERLADHVTRLAVVGAGRP